MSLARDDDWSAEPHLFQRSRRLLRVKTADMLLFYLMDRSISDVVWKLIDFKRNVGHLLKWMWLFYRKGKQFDLSSADTIQKSHFIELIWWSWLNDKIHEAVHISMTAAFRWCYMIALRSTESPILGAWNAPSSNIHNRWAQRSFRQKEVKFGYRRDRTRVFGYSLELYCISNIGKWLISLYFYPSCLWQIQVRVFILCFQGNITEW